MRTQKRNIQIALVICAVSFVIFTLFQFVKTEYLLKVGIAVENIIHMKIPLAVEDVRSYVITLFSGIFVSTLVAFVFYVHEYQRAKENTIRKVIELNKKINEVYNRLKYIGYDENHEFDQLARAYYLEYYDNEYKKEIKGYSKDILKNFPKKARRVLGGVMEENEYFKEENVVRDKILKFLSENPQYLQIGFEDKDTISPEQKLQDIVKEFDYKLITVKNTYDEILKLDLTEFNELLIDAECFKGFSLKKRKLLNEKMSDREIFSDLSFVNLKTIIDRMYLIHSRVQNLIKAYYKAFDIEEAEKYNKSDLLNAMLVLQKAFISSSTKSIAVKIPIPLTYRFNKLCYVVTNLEQVLWLDVHKKYEFYDTYRFALTKDQFENGGRTYVTNISGEDLKTNIFR